MRPDNLIRRKFIYKYPLFGNEQDINEQWQFPDQPEKINQTSKGIRWDQSVYYWWFQYLLRNKGFKQFCDEKSNNLPITDRSFASLFDAWGNIHLHKDDFRNWFYTIGGELFAEPKLNNAVEQTFPIRYRTEPKPDEVVAQERSLFLELPLDLPEKVLLKQAEELISAYKKKFDKNHCVDVTGKSKAAYPIYSNPNISALEKALKVWDMKKAGEKNTKIHEEVFGKITDEQIIEIKSKNGELIEDAKEINRYRQIRYATAVARAYKKAELMIFNTGLGKFPCTDKKP